MTAVDVAALRALLANVRLWPAPWTARTFEIDCPCPNGEHCGDSHTCEEVEALEAYPCGAAGEPASPGEGQCVVQIAIPGLETFARPAAEFIAAARNHMPALLDEVERLRALLGEIRGGRGDQKCFDWSHVDSVTDRLAAERDALRARAEMAEADMRSSHREVDARQEARAEAAEKERDEARTDAACARCDRDAEYAHQQGHAEAAYEERDEARTALASVVERAANMIEHAARVDSAAGFSGWPALAGAAVAIRALAPTDALARVKALEEVAARATAHVTLRSEGPPCSGHVLGDPKPCTCGLTDLRAALDATEKSGR